MLLPGTVSSSLPENLMRLYEEALQPSDFAKTRLRVGLPSNVRGGGNTLDEVDRGLPMD